MTQYQTVFDRFGGVRPMAATLQESPSTIQSWKTTGRIPAHKQPLVLEKARELGIAVEPFDVIFPNGVGDQASNSALPAPASPGAAEECAGAEAQTPLPDGELPPHSSIPGRAGEAGAEEPARLSAPAERAGDMAA